MAGGGWCCEGAMKISLQHFAVAAALVKTSDLMALLVRVGKSMVWSGFFLFVFVISYMLKIFIVTLLLLVTMDMAF